MPFASCVEVIFVARPLVLSIGCAAMAVTVRYCHTPALYLLNRLDQIRDTADIRRQSLQTNTRVLIRQSIVGLIDIQQKCLE